MRIFVLTAISLRFCALQTFAFIGKFSSPFNIFESESPITYKGVGCGDPRVRPLLDAIELAMYDEKRTGAIGNICPKYVESSRCVQRKVNCKAYGTFDVTTSGIKFMCVEQKNGWFLKISKIPLKNRIPP